MIFHICIHRERGREKDKRGKKGAESFAPPRLLRFLLFNLAEEEKEISEVAEFSIEGFSLLPREEESNEDGTMGIV